jgi:SAM-dependent methyltransferase
MVDATFIGSIPEHYDTYVGPVILEPFAADLVRRLPPRVDGDVLETACGTGILTRQLRARLDPAVRLVATDLSDAMLEYARRKLGEPAGVEWRQADAAALPFDSASFAAVACQLGVMFVPDKGAAMREARRVLADGGLFVFNVWDKLDAIPHARAASEALSALFPGDPVADFAKVPYGFNDEALIGGLLTEAAFGEIRFEASRIEIRSPSAKSLAIGMIKGTPRSLMLKERGASLEDVIDAVAAALTRVGGDSPFRTPAQTIIVTARAR